MSNTKDKVIMQVRKKRDSKQGDPQVDLEVRILTKSLGKESARVGGIVDMVSNIR